MTAQSLAADPSTSASSMDLHHLEELAALEDTYWWHNSKRELVLSLLRTHFPAPRRLIEGGIGGGGNLMAFHEAGYEVTGLDILPQAVEYGRRRGLRQLHCHDLLLPWPVAADAFDVVVLLDVLEHVPHPATLLRHAASVLRSRGGAIVTVPAYPWLFGPWDEQLGHCRRYTAARLRDDATDAGFKVVWLSHWNAFSLPAAVAVRFWQRQRNRGGVEFPRVRPWVNRWLRRAAVAERRWLLRHRLPVGLSLIGVLTR